MAERHVTESECEDKQEKIQEVLGAKIAAVAGKVRNVWRLIAVLAAILIPVAGATITYSFNESRSAREDTDRLNLRVETGLGRVESRIEGLCDREQGHRERVLKGMEDIRSEMRASKASTDGQIRDVAANQQRMMEIMLNISRGNGKSKGGQ